MIHPSHVEPIPIPDDLRSLLIDRLTGRSISSWATEALVVEAARQHIVSRRKAATLLGYEDYESREAFFERHQLNVEYTLEMWEQDRKAIEFLEGRKQQLGVPLSSMSTGG